MVVPCSHERRGRNSPSVLGRASLQPPRRACKRPITPTVTDGVPSPLDRPRSSFAGGIRLAPGVVPRGARKQPWVDAAGCRRGPARNGGVGALGPMTASHRIVRLCGIASAQYKAPRRSRTDRLHAWAASFFRAKAPRAPPRGVHPRRRSRGPSRRARPRSAAPPPPPPPPSAWRDPRRRRLPGGRLSVRRQWRSTSPHLPCTSSPFIPPLGTAGAWSLPTAGAAHRQHQRAAPERPWTLQSTFSAAQGASPIPASSPACSRGCLSPPPSPLPLSCASIRHAPLLTRRTLSPPGPPPSTSDPLPPSIPPNPAHPLAALLLPARSGSRNSVHPTLKNEHYCTASPQPRSPTALIVNVVSPTSARRGRGRAPPPRTPPSARASAARS